MQNQELDTFNYINVNNPNAKNIVLNLKDEMNLEYFMNILKIHLAKMESC